MQPRSIILAVLSILIVFVFLKLVLDTQGSAAPALEEAELQNALARYRQEQAQSTRTNGTPEYVAPPRRNRSVGSPVEPEPEAERERIPPPSPVEEEQVFGGDQVALKNQMNEANRFYDKADYEGARDAALEVLGNNPDNVRMLRIVVSTSCIMAEEEMATRYYQSLPDRDQRQMARRCARYGVEFDQQE